MANPDDSKKKGTFGVSRLPVALKYVWPDTRRKMIFIGGLACLGALVYFLADFFLLKSNFTTSGPLSSFHATFEKDCARCHDQFRAVTNDNCSVCHEKAGAKADDMQLANEQTFYTFTAHYVYRAMDLSRVGTARQEYGNRETPCYACHQEHLGRQAEITNVPDTRCTECHEYGSFNKKHPEFDFVAENIPDDSTMIFTHIRHVKEVVKRENLVDVERACLYCHNPQPDGKNFGLIDYDKHCDACHLTSDVATPRLAIKSPDDPLGVETLETIREQNRPGTQWAFYANPNEFKLRGSGLTKQPLYHEDPWVLENLKRIRRLIYPDQEFADLLKASGMLRSQSRQALSTTAYQEAIQTLQMYAMGLRGRPEPEIQQELARIDSLLKAAQTMLWRQANSVAGPAFMAQPAGLNPNFDATQIDGLKSLALDLTEACRKCHLVENANFQRVPKDQRILIRAEFDHRAHILERRCLECHTEIPIVKAPGDTTVVEKLQDRSAIQNIPAIDNCQECHNASESSNRCVTCHYFHPNKTNRSSLLLYLD